MRARLTCLALALALASPALAKPRQHGNVIFDLDCAAALRTVHGYLDELGIAYCGRYGDWKYIWTDESFMSGETAAKKVLAR